MRTYDPKSGALPGCATLRPSFDADFPSVSGLTTQGEKLDQCIERERSGSGGNFRCKNYHQITTDDHPSFDACERAVEWYQAHRRDCPHPVMPTLRKMFGLTAAEVLKVYRQVSGAAS